MPGSKAIKERIEQLIAEAPQLSGDHQSRAWLVAAQNAVELVCPSTANPYNARGRQLVQQAVNPHTASFSASEMAAMLGRLLEEIDGGLLTSIENHAIALTFDDFLDHGAEYLKRGRKDEAGVIAASCSRTRSGVFAATSTLMRGVFPWIR